MASQILCKILLRALPFDHLQLLFVINNSFKRYFLSSDFRSLDPLEIQLISQRIFTLNPNNRQTNFTAHLLIFPKIGICLGQQGVSRVEAKDQLVCLLGLIGHKYVKSMVMLGVETVNRLYNLDGEDEILRQHLLIQSRRNTSYAGTTSH